MMGFDGEAWMVMLLQVGLDLEAWMGALLQVGLDLEARMGALLKMGLLVEANQVMATLAMAIHLLAGLDGLDQSCSK